MKYADVLVNVEKLVADMPSNDEFIFELLLAYGLPKASITRMRKDGTYNHATLEGEVLWKKKVWFKPVDGDLFTTIGAMQSSGNIAKHAPRFLVVTDFTQLIAEDLKTGDTLDIELEDLDTNIDFFLPWAGMEKTKLSNENPADVKAAERMAKLFDAIRKDNPEIIQESENRDERLHAMNVFLSRLLFCLFAEDTGIFPDNSVTSSVASHTADDGSDLNAFFKQLFDWLDTTDKERGLTTESTEDTENNVGQASSLSADEGNGLTTKHTKYTKSNPCTSVQSVVKNYPTLEKLPYVNGGLFKDHYDVPVFSAKSRRMIIEAGKLDWKDINPDIFGSMFQAVIDPAERHNLGQHYTSVTNIMKVVEPLFLNDFKADLEKARGMTKGKKQALQRLLDRIANVKIFDPACGSGNFLIIAYKELRRLEMEVFQEYHTIEYILPLSQMSVSQFYGIEIDDFAHETAILALWLVEHQMNLESKKILGQAPVSLPLREGANIVQGNACRVDWETVCPKNKGNEIYILGNPPYLGSSMQNKIQKEDLALLCTGFKNFKNLDYISCWFLKATDYIKGANAISAFVSTNSVTQGEQVGLLWPHVFSKEIEIGFAHQEFKWTNNAKGNAGVTCVIIGLRNVANDEKFLFKEGFVQDVNSISPYLTSGSTAIIARRSSPLSDIPDMVYGNKSTENGHLILSKAERDSIIAESPEADEFIKKLLGSREFIRGEERWCIWIVDSQFKRAQKIPQIKVRLDLVRDFRLKSKAACTRAFAEKPHKFKQITYRGCNSIIIPRVSSERREYLPFGFLDANTVILDSAQAIYTPEPWVFGIISSKNHVVWVKATAGKLESRIRYSSAVCYNNFPIPTLTESQKQTLSMHVMNILEERENHPEKTIAQLYDPDKMPDGLREAHHQLDLAVDRLYRAKPFTSDEERLEHLFKLYEEMVAAE